MFYYSIPSLYLVLNGNNPTFVTIIMSISYGLDYNKATIYCDIFNFVVLQRFC